MNIFFVDSTIRNYSQLETRTD